MIDAFSAPDRDLQRNWSLFWEQTEAQKEEFLVIFGIFMTKNMPIWAWFLKKS
jgi:hypothetical protein